LQSKDVKGFIIEPFGPQMRLGLGFDQLSVDPDLAA